MIPCLRYRDCVAAIEWLSTVFGFTKQAIHTYPDGSIAHAQLTLGGGMVMLGSVPTGVAPPTPYDAIAVQPDEIGGRETQSIYLVVADCDAVYAAAKRAGATIIMELKQMDYGGKAFECRDPEGHVWSLGTYDPWA